jgi:hypothetical protein
MFMYISVFAQFGLQKLDVIGAEVGFEISALEFHNSSLE